MPHIIFTLLKKLSRAVLRKYHPHIVGITGSIGKTSTKNIVAIVLKQKFNLRASEKNYNNELGLPLTILGASAPGKSPTAWLKILFAFQKLLWQRSIDYPEMLVLEMGADKPGDLEYLTDVAVPETAIVTAVAPSHIEFFKTIENIAKEKSTLVKKMLPQGTAILNADDPLVSAMADQSPARVLTFGFSDQADIKILSHEFVAPSLIAHSAPWGISFKIEYEGRTMPMFLPYALARHQLYTAAAAIAAGIAYDINLVDISEALKKIKPLPGRLNLLTGIKNTTIVDDTYNSSPEACLAALEAVRALTARGRRWAILGDMLELGKMAADSHALVADKAATSDYDFLVAIGPRMSTAVEQLPRRANTKTFTFENSDTAGEFLRAELQSGDLVFLKGSQGMRLEKAVKNIMVQPQHAAKLLARQYGTWLDS